LAISLNNAKPAKWDAPLGLHKHVTLTKPLGGIRATTFGTMTFEFDFI
jgi:hypothetical protein